MNPLEELTSYLRHATPGKTYPKLAEAVAAYVSGLPQPALQALLAAGQAVPGPKPQAPSEEAAAPPKRLPVGWRPHYGGPCPVPDGKRVEVWTRGVGDVGIKTRASFWRRGRDLWRWEGPPEENIIGFKLCE